MGVFFLFLQGIPSIAVRGIENIYPVTKVHPD